MQGCGHIVRPVRIERGRGFATGRPARHPSIRGNCFRTPARDYKRRMRTELSPNPTPRPRGATLILLLALGAGACSDSGGARVEIAVVGDVPATAAAGTTLPVSVSARDGNGSAAAGIAIDAAVALGGGTIAPARATTDASGEAAFTWKVGAAPVENEIVLTADRAQTAASTRATLAVPYEPAPFGDVNAFLAAQGFTGSTEDLEFTPDGERLLLAVPGALLALDPAGNAEIVPLTGEPLLNPLGLAYDRDGNLWIADSGQNALLKVTPDGNVTKALTNDGTQDLVGPNYVAVGPDGRVYVSDPCIGELVRFDPERGVADAVLSFDLPTEGGPNGFAFDPTGKRLWLATENTGLLCGHPFVDITAPIASLFAIDVDDAGFGNVETVASDFALFGDGAAFDAEGNLYVIFDTQKDFMLEESAIWVLPAGSAQLEKVASVRGRVLANLAFGTPPFGEGELYISLLAVPPFTPATARGAERLSIGIPGLPLLP